MATGNRREFYYHKPRLGIAAHGAKPGTILFSGTIDGKTYEGTAYLFSARCGNRSYRVAGPVQESGGRVTMEGAATNVDANCSIKAGRKDVLVFDYLRRD